MSSFYRERGGYDLAQHKGSVMHVLMIGWLYVVVMISIVSESVLKGVVRFVFLGAIPVGLWMWFTIQKRRRQMEAAKLEAAQTERDDSIQ
jgi:Flp pilus assembly protein TadB